MLAMATCTRLKCTVERDDWLEQQLVTTNALDRGVGTRI